MVCSLLVLEVFLLISRLGLFSRFDDVLIEGGCMLLLVLKFRVFQPRL